VRDIPGITPRTVPDGAYDTADALVLLVSGKQHALRCREQLLAGGLATKILPEAYTWHFAETWSHMPELVSAHGGDLAKAFPASRALLERAVSLPVGVRMDDSVPGRVRTALQKALAP
jgi:8-amino-3,8-dideoxy-alpha-D-manno-octulosonate transaminase